MLISCLGTFNSIGQLYPPKNYPKNYFIWPVMARQEIVANFGELRSNHFHMGLDCRTEQTVNKKVLAAADGYVARVKVEPWGFGRAIYINHPNGLTTLYAHLNDFYPELEKYITERQYANKSWQFNDSIPANLFPVKKGSFIAYSGSTGGSMGPHVHFEIRDTKTDKVLNPLLFDMPLKDNVPPDIIRLAVYDRCISTYEQTPKIYALRKVNGIYKTSPGLISMNTDKVSFGISATDRYSGSNNPNGIYQAVLFDNAKPIVGFQLDSIGYDETRYLNANIDYKLKSGGGPYIQHLSKLPGVKSTLYKTWNGDGVIDITDDSIHTIKIEVKDTDGNVSFVQVAVKRNAAFVDSGEDGSPDFSNPKQFHPGFLNTFENPGIRFYLPENSLYDSIRFRFAEVNPNVGFTIYQIHNISVPLHSYFPVTIKAPNQYADKMVMHRFANGKDDYVKATQVSIEGDMGWYKASFREFGSFQLMVDTVPPTLTPVGFRDGMDCSRLRRILFSVKDNTEEIAQFTALLDGQWLRFSNDKGRNFIYEFDEHCAKGEHILKIIVEDQAGNQTEKEYKFTR